jgi:hypothetical protein
MKAEVDLARGEGWCCGGAQVLLAEGIAPENHLWLPLDPEDSAKLNRLQIFVLK